MIPSRSPLHLERHVLERERLLGSVVWRRRGTVSERRNQPPSEIRGAARDDVPEGDIALFAFVPERVLLAQVGYFDDGVGHRVLLLPEDGETATARRQS